MAIAVSSCFALLGGGWFVGGYAWSGALHDPGNAGLFELIRELGFVAITTIVLFALVLWKWRPGPTQVPFGQIAAEFRQSIRHGERMLRWLPFAAATMLVLLLCLLLLGLWSVRERTLEAGETTIAALRDSVASQIGTSLASVEHALGDVAYDLRHGVPKREPLRLQFDQSHPGPLLREVWLADQDGRNILESDAGDLGLDLTAGDDILHHREIADSGFFIGDPARSPVTGTWFVLAGAPYNAPDGTQLGVVVAALDPRTFSLDWDIAVGDSALVVILLRDDGAMLMRSPFSASNLDRAAAEREAEAWSRLALRAGSGVYEAGSEVDGQSQLYAWGDVPGYPGLTVIVGLPRTGLLAGWTRLVVVGLSAFVIVLGLAVPAVVLLLAQMRRRIASEKLSASLARYPLNNINPVMTISSTGEQLFLNKAARNLMESVEGTEGSRLLHQSLVAMARTTAPGTSELVIGSRAFAASHVHNSDGVSDIYLNDVTLLRQGESMLRLFFDLPFIGMALTSPQTMRWEQVNNRLCGMFGYAREELLALTWTEITYPDDLEADVAQFRNVLAGLSDGYVMDKRFLHKDGSIVHAKIDVKALRDGQGNISQFLATIEDISDQVLSREKLLRQRDLYAALSDTNHAIVMSTTRDELFQGVCRAAVERAGFLFASIRMVDAGTGELIPVARFGKDRGYVDAIHVEIDALSADGQGPGGRAMREGRHQIITRIAGDPEMAPWQAAAERAGVHANGAFPLMQDDRAVGVFSVYSEAAGVLNDDAVALLDEMARDISFALDNMVRERLRVTAQADLANAEARFRHAVEEAPFPTLIHAEDGEIINVSRSWSDISGYTREDIPTIEVWTELAYGAGSAPVRQEINTLYDLPSRREEGEFTVRCKDGARRIWRFSSVSLGHLPDSRRIAMSMAVDLTDLREAMERVARAEASYRGIVEQSLVGILLIDGDALLYANQLAADILGYKSSEIAGAPIEMLVSAADYPAAKEELTRVLTGAAAVGKLELMAKRKDGTKVLVAAQGVLTTGEGKPAVLTVIQDITERRRAEQEIQSYVGRLQTAFMSTVNLATTLSEMRDPYTAGHAAHVALIAAAIGEELGLDQDRIEGLRVAGQLHDIGKIKIPSELLSRPGRLLPAEFELIKYHAQAGYEVLGTVDFPWPVADVAHQHHERIDGSGYPQGLKGDAIRLEARIVAVADVVEAMSSHRPYRRCPRAGIGQECTMACSAWSC